jgi:hypothetical protein
MLYYKRIIISGDFNPPAKYLNDNSVFLSLLRTLNLVQLVEESTRESGYVLDMVVVLTDDALCRAMVVEGVFDHK